MMKPHRRGEHKRKHKQQAFTERENQTPSRHIMRADLDQCAPISVAMEQPESLRSWICYRRGRDFFLCKHPVSLSCDLFRQDLRQRLAHIETLFICKLREDWQRQSFFTCLFRDRVIAFMQVQAGVNGLQVNGSRVVDHAGHPEFTKAFLNFIPPGHSNGVLVEDMITEAVAGGCGYICQLGQHYVIARCYLASLGAPCIEMAQLHAQNGSLQLVQTAVP